MREPFSVAEGRKPYRYEQPMHGEWGRMTQIGGDRLVCHICGRDYKNVGTHAWWAHQVDSVEYRQMFRLLADTPLAAVSTRRRHSENNAKQRREGRIQLLVGGNPNRYLDPDVVRERALHASQVSAERRRLGLSPQTHAGGNQKSIWAAARKVVAHYESGRSLGEMSEVMADLAAVVHHKHKAPNRWRRRQAALRSDT